MAEFARPRVVGFNHVALEVGDLDEALAFYGRLFKFELAAKVTPWPSSTWAISSLPFRRAAGKRQTMGVTSVSSSTIRRWPARPLRQLVLPHLTVHSLIFGIPGAPSRDRWLRQHSVHEGTQCAAWHGAVALDQEREGKKGVG
jgi:catechol 2,3-dioxygenase-like lactoylglutathione lyase family enzyme